MTKSFILPLAILLFVACSTKNDNSQDVNTIEWDSLISQKPNLCSNLKTCVLKQSEKHPVGGVLQVVIADSLIFVRDNQEKVFEFKENGEFVCTIGRKGNAASEYIFMQNFSVDTVQNLVYIYDVMKGIKKYNYKGKYMGAYSSDVMSDCGAVYLIDNEHLLCHNDLCPENPYDYTLIDMATSEYQKLLPQIITSDVPIRYKQTVSISNDKVWAIAPISDTIYTASSTGITPAYLLNTPLRHATADDFSGFSDSEFFEAMSYASQSGISKGIQKIFATDRFLLFKYQLEKEPYYVLYDTYKAKGYKWLYDMDFSLWNNVICTSKDKFVCLYNKELYSLFMESWQGNADTDLVMPEELDDNSIVLLYFTPEMI
ncbi:MAG: 6-bladed beta-propeller [Bacteroidaceae bacterium]|nr:6-bladed beta-propeller [Bacteroidaceae bacterium]